MPDALQVTIDEPDESVRVDPVTGTIEVDQPDGGVVVSLDARRAGADRDDDWFRNLADELDGQQLAVIANDLIEAIEADDASRQGYLATRSRGLEFLGLEIQDPSNTADEGGISRVTHPLLLEAVIKGWANAQAELLPADGPAKIRDDGDYPGQDELAESFERDLNHWFTTTASEYYPDTSHMLLWGVYFGGSGFKKVYRCPMRRRPVSESVDAKDLIVSDTTKDLRACSRVTHQIKLRPSIMKRMQFIGAYRDVSLATPSPQQNQVDSTIAGIQGTTPSTRPEDQPYTIYETQCELDLDQFIPAGSQFKGEGIPLPYRVSIDKDSRAVLSLIRDWDEDDPECERKRMYVRYPFVPGPGFYCTGLVNILGNCSVAMTAAWRECLDAGYLANFPGGFFSKTGARQNSMIIRPKPGEFVPHDTGGLPISQTLMGMPYKDITTGMLSLMEKIEGRADRVGAAPDLPVGEGVQNVPVGTMLAAIEQATKVMAAAHKGMHQAQAEELQLIVNLFRENPEDFWRGNRVCPENYWDEQKFQAALDRCQRRVVPVSDPNVPSHMHRLARTVALLQLYLQFPQYLNPKEIVTRCLRALREDERGLLVDPPPQQAQPGPADLAKLLEANAKVTEAQTNANKAQSDAMVAWLKEQVRLQEAKSKENVAQLDYERQVDSHALENRGAAQQFGLDQEDLRLKAAVAATDARREDRRLDNDIATDQAKLAIERYQALHPPRPASPSKPKS